MSIKSKEFSIKNYKIISCSYSGSPILIKNNLWLKQTSHAQSNHIALYTPCSLDPSSFSIYNRVSRHKIKTLRKPATIDISHVLHLPNTSNLILWSNQDSWGLSLWNVSTNQRTKIASIKATKKFHLELNSCKNDASEFVTSYTEDWTIKWIQVTFWNSHTFKCIDTLRFECGGDVLMAQVNFYANKIVAFTYDHVSSIKVWKMSTDNRLLATVPVESNTNIEGILIRKNNQNQFVTVHRTWNDRKSFISIHAWTERNDEEEVKFEKPYYRKKCLYSEDFYLRWSLISLFDMNGDEFASLNQMNGKVKV